MRWPWYQNLTKTLYCPISLSCHNKIPQNEWLNNRNLFLIVLQAGNSKIKMLDKLVSQGGPPSWFIERCLPAVSSHALIWWGEWASKLWVSSSFYKDTSSIMGASPTWALPNLTAFQRSNLQIPSHRTSTHMFWGDTNIQSITLPPEKDIPHKHFQIIKKY